MKVILFSDREEYIRMVRHTLQESLLALQRRIDYLQLMEAREKIREAREKTPLNLFFNRLKKEKESPLSASYRNEIVLYKRLFADIERSPFELTVLRDTQALLEATGLNNFSLLLVDMYHAQARIALRELRTHHITPALPVKILFRMDSQEDTGEDFALAHEYGATFTPAKYNPLVFLHALVNRG